MYVLYFSSLRALKMPEPEGLLGGKHDPFVRITTGVGPKALVAESSVKWGANTSAYWTHEEVRKTLVLTLPFNR